MDLTREGESTHRVGEDVCVRAGPSARLTLMCGVVQGVPTPTIQWLENGQEIPNVTNSNSLILTLPSDASVSSKQEIEGNYSCVATNEAGITTASTYVTLFGGM